ncbi:MAG: MFS transporter [Xanthomonadaceae bacterium]|nr:MFS transporter [Xanthomonadaceae bacterium]
MSKKQLPFSVYEKNAILILVLLQFTLVLDFMVMAPLGAVIMPAFQITPHEFSILIASYALSACFSGLLSSGIADRFERKRYLVWIYLGFLLGTFACSIVNTFWTLFAARIITGLFGGIIASLIQTITTDIFSEDKRGQVIGFTQISFGFCQVFGLPIALYFSNHWGWHSPFKMVVVLGILLLAFILNKLRPIHEHLALVRTRNQWKTITHLLSQRKNIWGFIGTSTLTLGGYLLMPFTSAYNVNNLGMSLDLLPYYYLSTGVSVILFTPIIGKLSDQLGNLKVFFFGVFFTAMMSLIYTNTTQAGFLFLCLMNILLFAGFFSMIIPFQSLITRLPSPENRAGFMSINSSVQQLGGGISVLIAGYIVTKTSEGKLQNFPELGFTLTVILATSLFVSKRIQRLIR